MRGQREGRVSGVGDGVVEGEGTRSRRGRKMKGRGMEHKRGEQGDWGKQSRVGMRRSKWGRAKVGSGARMEVQGRIGHGPVWYGMVGGGGREEGPVRGESGEQEKSQEAESGKCKTFQRMCNGTEQ